MYNLAIRRWSALQECVDFSLDGPEGVEVVALLGALHAFGGEDAAEDLLPEELCDEGAGEAVVNPLLVFGVDLIVLGAHPVEVPEGVLVHVIVHIAADQSRPEWSDAPL